MADNTIIQQGSFTSTGAATTIQLRSDLDWMQVYNWTQLATQQSTGRGVQFYWQRGMAAGAGIEYKKTNSTDALNAVALTSGGFTLVNSSILTPGAINSTITAVSTASVPVVSATIPSGSLTSNSSVVRLINVAGAQQLGGLDFTVGTVTSTTSFTLAYMSQLSAAGTTGSYRVIPYDPLFYPSHRYITAITAANPAVITLSVKHNYVVGQQVRVMVPAAYGMVEINNIVGNITAIDTSANTITTDIDASTFTAFAFPLTAAVPFTPAMVVPVGETANANISNPNLLDDATLNSGYIGIQLAGGAQSPAGSASDVIYWVAGKSFNI